jgi:hypothetical protein
MSISFLRSKFCAYLPQFIFLIVIFYPCKSSNIIFSSCLYHCWIGIVHTIPYHTIMELVYMAHAFWSFWDQRNIGIERILIFQFHSIIHNSLFVWCYTSINITNFRNWYHFMVLSILVFFFSHDYILILSSQFILKHWMSRLVCMSTLFSYLVLEVIYGY